MKCENCSIEHDGAFGSGRFCAMRCARSFGAKMNREIRNAKTSNTLKSRKTKLPFQKGVDIRRKTNWTLEERKIAGNKIREKMLEKSKKIVFDLASRSIKKRRILIEQENKCLWCGISSWREQRLVLELDHINGNKADNRRENLRCLCPNCHSQTETFRRSRK